MPFYAAIDAGTNAIRMLIAGFDPEKGRAGFKRLRYERRTTRLGAFECGSIPEGSMKAALEVFKEYCQIISGYDFSRIIAVGTSALREAANSKDLIKDIFYETGIRVEVISPEREACLAALGVTYFLPQLPPYSLILDTGGGSTEWALVKETALIKWGSIPVGVVKLWEKIKGLPDWEKVLQKELSSFSFTLKEGLSSFSLEGLALVATGGTASAIAMIDLASQAYEHEKIQGHRVSLQKLKEIYGFLKKLTLPERALVKGLPADRADLIMPGIGLTIDLMDALGFDQLVVSDTGLPEGIIISSVQE
jgi:exopolyphosphatase/guanosine-5'-triphosphate,3'-diphosphate pyrophosphatase